MTDIAYVCHNCGSVHEIESIRENLILSSRTAASYESSGRHGVLYPRQRFVRWHLAVGLLRALWPGYRSSAPEMGPMPGDHPGGAHI